MAFSMNQCWTGPSRPRLTRPKVLGCYSFDNEFKDSSVAYLRYFYEPELSPVEFDLNKGFEVTDKNIFLRDNQNIERTLHWISNNSNCITASPEEDRWLQPHFVSNRRAFNHLLQAYYQKHFEWILSACRYRGTIYLNYSSTDRYKKEQQERSDELLRYAYWGLKIDEYLLTNDPHTAPNASEGSIPDQEFACVYKTCLGDHTLLYSARIDGTSAQEVVKDLEELKQKKFIDIKSNWIMKTEKHAYNLRLWKTLGWWSANILVDSEYIVCGFRDDNGIVRSLTKFTLRDLVTLGKDHWDQAICLNFCNSFLSHVQCVVTRDYDDCVYKFEYTPGPPDAKPRVPPVVNMEELESSSALFNKYSFLPSWYIEKCNELAA